MTRQQLEKWQKLPSQRKLVLPGAVIGLALWILRIFYLGKWGDTPAKLKRTYGTFEKFKKTWTKEVLEQRKD